jgi:hypothetical protein
MKQTNSNSSFPERLGGDRDVADHCSVSVFFTRPTEGGRERIKKDDEGQGKRDTFREVVKDGLAIASLLLALPTAAIVQAVVVEGVDDGVSLTEIHWDLSCQLVGRQVERDQRAADQVDILCRDGSSEVVVIQRQIQKFVEPSWRRGK